MRFCLLLLLLLFPLTAEAVDEAVYEENLPPGAVATVNGHVITLRQIEAFHDVSGEGLVMAQSPSVELLQEQYGSSLCTLIVQALMQQELKRRDLAVTDEEVLAVEAQVRADYATPELFEKELQGEYIELSVWRELTYQHLVAQRFQQRVLRPRFTIAPEEVEAYYRENKSLFLHPEQVELLWFQDADKTTVETLRVRWIKEQDKKTPDAGTKDAGTKEAGTKKETERESKPAAAASTPIDWDSEKVRVGPERLPAQLRKDLAVIKPGQATPVRQEGNMYQFAVLCRTLPARTLSAAEALPFIEQTLVEARLEPAYAAWIEETLPQAVIRIAPGLRQGQTLPDTVLPDSGRRANPFLRTEETDESESPEQVQPSGRD